jgi:hypothetical protein
MQTSHPGKSLFVAEKKLTFFLLCLATFLLLYIKKAFIESETAAFVFLEDRPEGSILQLVSAIQFISIPFVYLWKFTVIAFVIWVGSFLFGYRITYSQCWGLSIASEFVFLVPEIIKIIWFFFIETDPRLSDVNAFYPLSLMNFFDYYDIDKRYVYPLKALNIFEIGYWFLLVEGVHFFAKKKRKVAWLIISCSYILIFVLWLWFYIVVYK